MGRRTWRWTARSRCGTWPGPAGASFGVAEQMAIKIYDAAEELLEAKNRGEDPLGLWTEPEEEEEEQKEEEEAGEPATLAAETVEAGEPEAAEAEKVAENAESDAVKSGGNAE